MSSDRIMKIVLVGDSGVGGGGTGHRVCSGETQLGQVGITYLALAFATWHACTRDAPALLAIVAAAVLLASPRLLGRRIRSQIRRAVIHGGRRALMATMWGSRMAGRGAQPGQIQNGQPMLSAPLISA